MKTSLHNEQWFISHSFYSIQNLKKRIVHPITTGMHCRVLFIFYNIRVLVLVEIGIGRLYLPKIQVGK